LKELLAQRERALFGPSSEQRPRQDSPPPPPPSPRRGHGPTAQPRLPIVETIHELDDADRTCPQCGGTLKEMTGQTEDSEEITVVERQYVLVKHQRKKYRCACNGCVDTAPAPPRLAARPDRRGHRYAPAFAVEVAIDKYLDHLPLERQARRMGREGLAIDSQTLWDQIDALATVLQPTYEALQRYVLAAPVIGADETWWRFLQGRGAPRWWAWSVTRADAVAYTILGRAQNARTGRRIERQAALAGDPRLCSRCREAPRVRGQRWCRGCRTSAQRGRHARVRGQGHEYGAAVVPPWPLGLGASWASGHASGSPREIPDVSERRRHRGRPTPPWPRAILQPTLAEALARLRGAEDAYERARKLDWRRSLVAPGVVLQPLANEVLRARAEYRRIGVAEVLDQSS
jgi:transposase